VSFGCWSVHLPCRSDQMMRSCMSAVGLSEKNRESCGVAWGLCFGGGKAEKEKEGLVIP